MGCAYCDPACICEYIPGDTHECSVCYPPDIEKAFNEFVNKRLDEVQASTRQNFGREMTERERDLLHVGLHEGRNWQRGKMERKENDG